MPLYEYECQTEGSRFEVIQKFSDPPVEICPSCGGPVRRLLSSPAIRFKGSGFYITDYARKGSTEGGKDSAAGKDSASTTPASTTSSSDGSSAKPSTGSSSPGSGKSGSSE